MPPILFINSYYYLWICWMWFLIEGKLQIPNLSFNGNICMPHTLHSYDFLSSKTNGTRYLPLIYGDIMYVIQVLG